MTPSRFATIATVTLALLAGACGGDDVATVDVDPPAAAATPDDTADDAAAADEAEPAAAADEPADDAGDDADDGAPAENVSVAAALASQLRADPDSPVRTDEEAACMSSQVVDRFGEDRLLEIGVTAESTGSIEDLGFTTDEITTVVDVMFECIDVRDRIADELETQFGEEAATCIADELDQETLSFMISLAFQGGIEADLPPDFLEMFIALMQGCGVDIG